MAKTNYISVSVTLLAALLAVSLLALALPHVASSQEEGDKQTPGGGGGDASVSAAEVGIESHQVLEKEIESTGRLSSIWVNDQLGCQVDHSGNGAGGEFFDGTQNSLNVTCGTWLAVGTETFGQFYEELTPVGSQTLSGKGTRRKPFKITTVADVGNEVVGNTGLRVTEVDSYRVADDFYRTKVTIKNRTNHRINAILYRGGDCYLNLTDSSTKAKLVGSNQPACFSTDSANPEEITLIPISSGSNYHAGSFEEFYNFETQEPYANTIVNGTGDTEVDSYVGLSWNISVGAGNQVTRSHFTKVTIPAD